MASLLLFDPFASALASPVHFVSLGPAPRPGSIGIEPRTCPFADQSLPCLPYTPYAYSGGLNRNFCSDPPDEICSVAPKL